MLRRCDDDDMCVYVPCVLKICAMRQALRVVVLTTDMISLCAFLCACKNQQQ